MDQPAVGTLAEIKAQRRQCWWPQCKRKAFLIDWKGWKWCLPCWWRQARDNRLRDLRTLRIF